MNEVASSLESFSISGRFTVRFSATQGPSFLKDKLCSDEEPLIMVPGPVGVLTSNTGRWRQRTCYKEHIAATF